MIQQPTPEERDAQLHASPEERDLAPLPRLGDLAGPYRADWTSLTQYRAPKWYEDARFGAAIHWGAVSELENFDARMWARTLQQAGARYIVSVTNGYDGSARESARLPRETQAGSASRRDLPGELRTAARAERLYFGLTAPQLECPPASNGHLEGLSSAATAGRPDDWLARAIELVRRYEPELVCFDSSIDQPAFHNTAPRFLAYYYNHGASRGGVVVSYEERTCAPGKARLHLEHAAGPGIPERIWQTHTSISSTPSGSLESPAVESAAPFIHALADVVSKNGNLLIEITPRPDGSLAEPMKQVMSEIGAWLKVNGEAIYASKPWVCPGEGPTTATHPASQETRVQSYTAQDFRFTTRGRYVYAIGLSWPEQGEALIRSVTPNIYVHEVRLLASGKAVPFSQTEDGLYLLMPRKRPGEHAWVYRIETSSVGS